MGINKISSVFRIIIALFLLSLFVYTSDYLVKIISFPGQLELRETAMISITDGVLSGQNIYSLETRPKYSNTYGFVYHYFVAPFTYLPFSKFSIHRGFNIACLILLSLLVAYFIYKQNGDIIMAGFGFLLNIIGVIYYLTPLARPDCLGMLLYFVSVAIMTTNQSFLVRSILSIGSIILAFYTKPYFILGFATACFIVLFFEGWKRVLIYSFSTFLVACLSLILVQRVFPLFYLEVIDINRISSSFDFEYSVRQLYTYVRIQSPSIWILGGATFLITVLEWKKANNLGFWFDKKRKLQATFGIGLLLAILAFLFKLGGHIGNYMCYIFHLITPFLLVFALGSVRVTKRVEYYGAIFLLFLGVHTSLKFNRGFDYHPLHMENWHLLKELVDNNKAAVGNAVSSLAIGDKRTFVIDDGLRASLPLGGLKEIDRLRREYPRTFSNCDKYSKEINKKLEMMEWDILLLDHTSLWPISKDILSDYYILQDTIEIKYPHSQQTWDVLYFERRPD